MTATLYENVTGEAVVVILEVAGAFLCNCRDCCLEQTNADVSSLTLSALYLVCCPLSSCTVVALACSCFWAFIWALCRQSRSWGDAVVLLHTSLSTGKREVFLRNSSRIWLLESLLSHLNRCKSVCQLGMRNCCDRSVWKRDQGSFRLHTWLFTGLAVCMAKDQFFPWQKWSLLTHNNQSFTKLIPFSCDM